MKLRKNLWIVGLLILGLLVFGSQTVLAKPIKIKAASAMPESHPSTINLRYMAERVKEVANGLIDLEVFSSGSVGGEADIIESVSEGSIQIFSGAISPMVSYVPEYKIFDLPYLFKDRDHVDRVCWGPTGNEIAKLALKKGFRILGWTDSGFQGLYDSKRQIKTLDDMKGLKMRVMKNSMRIKAMNAFGASAVPISWPETYGAMETKVVDGCENSYETYRSGRHYEVAKYYTESDHQFLLGQIMISEKFYKTLTPRLKAIINYLGGISALRNRQIFEEKNAQAKVLVQEKGAIVYVLPESERKKFRAAVQPLYDEYTKEFGSELLDKIKAAE
jgi:tripartite ATP-independent transporter DctP family solute receptor